MFRVHARTSKGTIVSKAVPTYKDAQDAVALLLDRTAEHTALRKVEIAIEKYGETTFRKATFVRSSSKSKAWTI